MTGRFARVLLYSSAFIVYAVDRFSKLLVLGKMRPGESVAVLPGIFHMTLVLNDGAAFGLFKDRAAFFIAASAAVAALIMIYGWREKALGPWLALSLGLILGGSLGNLVDRLTYGIVVDYFDFRVWPVFNVADSAICAGTGLLIISSIAQRPARR
jgi:signal peptidase II